MKTKAKSITITFSESPDFGTPRAFSDFESANTFLRELSRNAPGPHEGYFKTDFTITFEDGETYSGRIDLTNFETPDLGAHVRKFVEFYSGGLACDQLPSHISPSTYRTTVLRNMDTRDASIRFRDNYQLGDIDSSCLTKAE
jgi:hypothetical protein